MESVITFAYPGRDALVADGWSFLARTPAGGTRNTEQNGLLGVSYDQLAHPGAVRVPLPQGELWQNLNSSANTLFRDLPGDWTSIRLRIASFNPVANFQQVGLIAYQDDDTYVNVLRFFNAASGGPVVGFYVEKAGVADSLDRRLVAGAGPLTLRLDRDPVTGVFTAFYSTNDGGVWVQLTGAPTVVLSNPKLAIQCGANQSATTVTADLGRVEIHSLAAGPLPVVPPPALLQVSPATAAQGETVAVTLIGAGFQTGAACSFGAGIGVQSTSFISATQLMASVAVAPAATAEPRTVTVTNPGGQSSSLPAAFTVTGPGPLVVPTSGTLTVAVLVNSLNATGYSEAPASPGEFQRYPKLYLDHFQIPYEVIDTAVTPPPADLAARHLILSGHSGLALSPAWQTALTGAVGGGTGFVNLDADPSIGSQSHIQGLFGASGAALGTAATTITVPAAVLSDGSTPHFIAACQKRFLGDAGDLQYPFHKDAGGVLRSVTPTVLSGATGTVIARLGASPLILARTAGAGRAVHFGSYLYLKADRFGFVQGVDDLFWRSLVWAARKPFVLRGYPRFWTVQMDDTEPGWGLRVRDLYSTALTGLVSPDGTGGPWKVTGYCFTRTMDQTAGERQSVIADITAGSLHVAPHSFDNAAFGNCYWSVTPPPEHALSDDQWLANMGKIDAWRAGNGTNGTIPGFSRALVAHYWTLSDNTGHDLWTRFGFRYMTSIQRSGFARVVWPNLNRYNGAERLRPRPYWPYEQPPKLDPSESSPFFFADDYPVGSRAGLPPRVLFLFASQYIDLARFPRNDFAWPGAKPTQTVAKSLDNLQRYTWRHWSGLNPVQLFTHDSQNYQLASVSDRQSLISQGSAWLAANGVRHVHMEQLGDYIYARTKSVLERAQVNADTLLLTFAGAAATADGTLVPTEVLVFHPDKEGVPVTVAGFSAPTVATVPLPPPA